MDELWQRYRTFWTPVLIGIGVLLVGLIVVFAIHEDPDDVAGRIDAEAKKVNRTIRPENAEIAAERDDAALLKGRVAELARRVDAVGTGRDVVQAAVEDALRAAILRGGGGAEAFDGDAAAASAAEARYERTVKERVDLLRSADPNVGFGRLLNDVWSELRLRANRADVDLEADQLGFTAVSSVNRATLAQRLLNLALAARVVDLGIRSGVASVDDIRFESRATGGPDDFLVEWPVTFTITGTTDALRPILSSLQDPDRTTPLSAATMAPPRRAPKPGMVELVLTAVSTRVQPDASLDLAAEEPR